MKLASQNTTEPWSIEDLDIVLKGLKTNKSRDPLGYLNELFKPGVIGDDLKLGLLKLMNRIGESRTSQSVLKYAIYPASLNKREVNMNSINTEVSSECW